jgi:molybdopterin biosynthesis enzyme
VRRLGRRTRALPARLEGGRIHPLADASHQIARAAAADGLVLVEAGEGELAAGSEATFVSL